jgi:hypothetical protein
MFFAYFCYVRVVVTGFEREEECPMR